jgi:hypothetical protein
VVWRWEAVSGEDEDGRACVGCWFGGLCGNGGASGAGETMESWNGRGVLGSVMKTTIKDPGRRWLFCWLEEGAGWFVLVEISLGLGFFCISHQMCKITPPCVL